MAPAVSGVARRLIAGRGRRCTDAELALPAVVFAPHPDDETLGCGGTVLRKRAAGADVHIVFMTDGAQSHPGLFAPERMRAVRAEEAVAAARALGVQPDCVHLLAFPDGQLIEHHAEAVRQVTDLLRTSGPVEVFVPYHDDGPPDHQATTQIVQAALEALGQPMVVCEYPIWFWYHWPWTRLQGGVGERWHGVKQGWRCALALLRDFRWAVPIGAQLEQKRAALHAHRSQMERLVADADWLTLGDIAGGDFLACFFQAEEIFCRQPFRVRGAARAPGGERECV